MTDSPGSRPSLGTSCRSSPGDRKTGANSGAFTGAVASKIGLFERADHGTVFLDEIGELPPSAQVRLLRVLQTMQFERVGTITSNVRVIAATHRDLLEMVRADTFREDLWYRLSVFPIRIPPLRERKDDIAALAYHFIESGARYMHLAHRPTPEVGALEQLLVHDWPGNVSELRNVLERALILSHGGPLSFPLVGADSAVSANLDHGLFDPRPPMSTFAAATTRHVRHVPALAHGRIKGPSGAAELLDVAPGTLQDKMKRLGIKPLRTDFASK